MDTDKGIRNFLQEYNGATRKYANYQKGYQKQKLKQFIKIHLAEEEENRELNERRSLVLKEKIENLIFEKNKKLLCETNNLKEFKIQIDPILEFGKEQNREKEYQSRIASLDKELIGNYQLFHKIGHYISKNID